MAIDPNFAEALSVSDVPGGERIQTLPDNLVIRQLYLGCLSQAAYLVGDTATGRAIAVDPRRDIDEILTAAQGEKVSIELVVQTHFHADFLSGHLELSAATGAEIAYGPGATTEFPSLNLNDGEVIDLGGVQIEVLATPGHTPESISLVVRPAPGVAPVAVLTGDALFIGDVGRPDLLVAIDIPAEDLASQLYDSVHRLLELPDETLVLPAHGAGSACGKALSSETVSTIGEQRRTNYAVQPMSEADFIALVTEGQPLAPAYFGRDAMLNRQNRPLLEEHDPPRELSLEEVDAALAGGAVLVDTRSAEEFAQGHLVGSLSVCLGGRFAEQVGTIVDMGTPIVLLGSLPAATEAKIRLGRIGFDTVVGVLTEPEVIIAQHPKRARRLSRLTATGLDARRSELGARLQLIDVRNPSEVEAAAVPGARNIPLARLREYLTELPLDRPVVLVCAGGARSAIASSLLSASGFDDVSDVLGGATALGVGAACTVDAT